MDLGGVCGGVDAGMERIGRGGVCGGVRGRVRIFSLDPDSGDSALNLSIKQAVGIPSFPMLRDFREISG